MESQEHIITKCTVHLSLPLTSLCKSFDMIISYQGQGVKRITMSLLNFWKILLHMRPTDLKKVKSKRTRKKRRLKVTSKRGY